MFIAGRMGLDDDMLQAIHVAGLLHDMGARSGSRTRSFPEAGTPHCAGG